MVSNVGTMTKNCCFKRIVVAHSIVLLGVLLPSCGGDRIFRQAETLMGTVVEVTVVERSEDRARRAIREALAEIRRVDDLVSTFKSDSVVSHLNREGRATLPSAPDLLWLLRQAEDVSAASGGAFDVTIRPLVELWGFGGERSRRPAQEELAAAIAKVGYNDLVFDGGTHSVGFRHGGRGVDLGGIAAGWAADLALARLQSLGVRSAIVDAGGELRVMGEKPGGVPWRIGVQHPRRSGTLLLSFDLGDTAIATSGDYERFFTEEGVRYHHVLDPATGMSARGCQSVTVLAPTAVEADACSTAAFVLGPERGLAFLRSRPGVRGVIVDARGQLHWTDQALERMARR